MMVGASWLENHFKKFVKPVSGCRLNSGGAVFRLQIEQWRGQYYGCGLNSRGGSIQTAD